MSANQMMIIWLIKCHQQFLLVPVSYSEMKFHFSETPLFLAKVLMNDTDNILFCCVQLVKVFYGVHV